MPLLSAAESDDRKKCDSVERGACAAEVGAAGYESDTEVRDLVERGQKTPLHAFGRCSTALNQRCVRPCCVEVRHRDAGEKWLGTKKPSVQTPEAVSNSDTTPSLAVLRNTFRDSCARMLCLQSTD